MRFARNTLAGMLFLCAALGWAAPAIPIDADDIAGVVKGPKGSEAGVWVIAETTDLPTKMARIVVTDDQGRYLIPDLPKAKYKIWVRGYGLVDSKPVASTSNWTYRPATRRPLMALEFWRHNSATTKRLQSVASREQPETPFRSRRPRQFKGVYPARGEPA